MRLFTVVFVLLSMPGFPQSVLKKRVPDKLVVLTFDDAVKSHYSYIAPLLKKYGFDATFYVCEFPPDFNDTSKYMSWPEMQQLSKWGFEIGNHTRDHTNVDQMDRDRLADELGYIERKCDSLKMPRPVNFAYPAYHTAPYAVTVLEQRGYSTARIGGDRLYDPEKDNPYYLPSVTMTATNHSVIMAALEHAVNGKILILTIHGVPDKAHPWVSTPPEVFEEYIRYMKEHHYKVISMSKLAKYIDFAKAEKLSLPPGENKKALDSLDKVIIKRFIEPAVEKAGNTDPSWISLDMQIRSSYTDVQADRAITKSQIFFYYGKNWPQFTNALVHFTETYEDRNDFKLMNKNAGYILKYSNDKSEIQKAISWIKPATEKEPDNEEYKATYKALVEKLK